MRRARSARRGLERDPGAGDTARVNTRPLIAAWLVLLGAGCAALPANIAPPTVSVSGLQLTSLDLFEQHYLVRVRIENGNDTTLPITGMQYTLEVNGRAFAHGAVPLDVSVPAYAVREVDLPVVSTLGDIVDLVERLDSGRATGLAYRISGRIKLRGRNAPLEFAHRAQLLPPAQDRPERAPAPPVQGTTALRAARAVAAL